MAQSNLKLIIVAGATILGALYMFQPLHLRAENKPPIDPNCLVKSERGKVNPDLKKLNWRGMSEDEVEVCLQQILPNLGDRADVEEWIISLGFLPERILKCNPRDKFVECLNFTRQGDLSRSILWPRPIRAYAQVISIKYEKNTILSIKFNGLRL